MDLGFSFTDVGATEIAVPHDLALLLVGMAAQQAASPTAARHARLTRTIFDETLFTPLDGAFNGPVACVLARWKEE